jgi:Kef-type K+ transport system membrane component KefB
LIDGAPQPKFSSQRLVAHYTLLALVTAAAFVFVISQGHGKHAAPQIAGGYEVLTSTACLGQQVELQQSGSFVSIFNALSTVSGSLRIKDGLLSGTVHCVKGAPEHLQAHVTSAAAVLSGSLGQAPLRAEFKHEPPPPGTPKPLAPGSVAGEYQLAPASSCLGGSLTLKGSASKVTVVTAKKSRGKLSYHKGVLAGTVSCNHGPQRRRFSATAVGRTLDIMLLATTASSATPAAGSGSPAAGGGSPGAPGGSPGTAGGHEATATAAPVAASERLQATEQRTSEGTVAAFFLAVIVVMIFARLCGSLMPRIGQARVMGEVLAGILLGPTAFGAIDPGLQASIFASDIVPYIGVAANLGLVFYMFLIGLEVDLGQLRGRVRMTLAVSNTALLLPLIMGLLVALPLYTVLAPNTRFLAFALFVGISMSVTAFPVLARIVAERRMIKRPLGALALSAAAVDDVSAWFLIALATAIAGAGSGLIVLRTIGLAALFCLGMGVLVRPLLARAAVAYEEVGRLPGAWITAVFAGVLISAFLTDKIGIAVIFGAFVMGLSMPRHAGLSDDVTRRVEDFVITLLLPLFFAYTGLRTNVGLLGSSQLILITLGLCGIAIVGKYGGTLIAARVIGLPWRESGVLGALMNTRGLTELIVLNLALSMGVISSALFTALVLMALLTTLMASPIMRLLDPHNSLGEAPEAELALAKAQQPPVEPSLAPAHSILVAPQTAAATEQLLALADPLARSQPPRELILARLVRPPRGSGIRGGLRTEARALQEASEQVQLARERLTQAGVAARAVAFSSADPGRDLARLCRDGTIDLVMMDGRRPLLGQGVPREEVGTVLRDAPCDVAVLVAPEGATIAPGPDCSVMVPFGGADYDWAALELATWIAAATKAPLRLLGASGASEGGKDAGALLANASLVVQQFAGVVAEPVLAPAGRKGIVSAASEAGLLIVGLSDRWRKEGLGDVRQAIARAAPVPIVFVRRGERPGALAPSTEMTRFGWSTAAMGSTGTGTQVLGTR